MNGEAKKGAAKRAKTAPRNRNPKRKKYSWKEGDIFLIDKIVGKRVNPKTGMIEYLLKWIGFSDSDNTWEPKNNIFSQCLVDDYEKLISENKTGGDSAQKTGENQQTEEQSGSSAKVTAVNPPPTKVETLTVSSNSHASSPSAKDIKEERVSPEKSPGNNITDTVKELDTSNIEISSGIKVTVKSEPELAEKAVEEEFILPLTSEEFENMKKQAQPP